MQLSQIIIIKKILLEINLFHHFIPNYVNKHHQMTYMKSDQNVHRLTAMKKRKFAAARNPQLVACCDWNWLDNRWNVGKLL